MTSACINTPHIPFSPDKFLHHLPPSYSALTPPTTPLSGQMHHQQHDSTTTNNTTPTPEQISDLSEQPDPDASDGVDFEFRLEQPVDMLPADQLFSDGKLFPMHFPVVVVQEASSSSVEVSDSIGVRSTAADPPESSRIINGVAVVDSFLYASKAPKCSSKWKELLGLRKLYQNSSNATATATATASSPASGNTAIKSIKHFLYRSSKSSSDPSVSLPLLNDTDNEPPVVPSRHSLSSSSSGHDPEELPRLSLDSEKTLKANTNTNPNSNPNNPPRMKLVKTRTLSSDGSMRSVSTESPRMNSSGKIVFHSLERSSSSPSSFNGGHRSKHRGMERSYSGNVRITPVLNVPVYSLRGFPLFSSSQKHEGSSNSNSNNNRGGSRNQQMNNKSKTDRS